MGILDILFPKRCVSCKRFGTFFCQNCISKIAQTDLVCPFCEQVALGGVVHPVCRRTYGLDGLWSFGVYQDPLQTVIKSLKYKFLTELAEILVDETIHYWVLKQPIILDRIKKDRGKGWIVVPVPLHKHRQNWRGFNQSALLGKILAKKLGLEYQAGLIRSKNTKPQSNLYSSQRRSNIKGAFSLSSDSQSLGSNILLIDDVWTTGATVKECCYILKRGGAKSVWGVTIAR